MPPILPGKILLEEFLIFIEISQYRLATDIGVQARRINELVRGMCSIAQILRAGCRDILDNPNDSGSIFRHITTWILRKID